MEALCLRLLDTQENNLHSHGMSMIWNSIKLIKLNTAIGEKSPSINVSSKTNTRYTINRFPLGACDSVHYK